MKMTSKIALFLALSGAMLTESKATDSFTCGSISTTDTTATVAVSYSTGSPNDSLSVAVVTIEYNGNIARFREVTAGPAGWYVATVNDNQHVTCQSTSPMRKITAIVSGDYIECDDEIVSGAIANFRFGKVANGTTQLTLTPNPCGEIYPNHGANCTGSVIIMPTLTSGYLTFSGGGHGDDEELDKGPGTPVQPVTWQTVKALYR